jgi:DNA-binding CsgD family transcriptional regulator
MNLSQKETGIVFKIMHELTRSRDATELRRSVGMLLLRLLDAQYLASYVWDPASRQFVDRVSINMDDANLGNYESYFQFRDPITPTLQRRRTATCVSEIIDRKRFERTEFFNDFLSRDGLHYGVNFYAYAGGHSIGDLRIWRGRNKEDFSRRDVQILDAIGVAFTQALINCRLAAAPGEPSADVDVLARIERIGNKASLTPRQKEIVASILFGNSDRAIADELCISLPTVRTHVQMIYQKLGVSSRTQLARRLLLN